MGGIGSERPVSLLSGANISNALEEAGVRVVRADIRPDELSVLEDATIDVFFLALHGTFGEDGTLQKILEERGLAFTGSDSRSSRISMDKAASKAAFEAAGAKVAPQLILENGMTAGAAARAIAAFGPRYVVKPVYEGSSVGVEILDGAEPAANAGLACLKKYGSAMIEQFIRGREITVGVVDGTALPIIEIRPKNPFYDFQAKYESEETQYLFDTISNAALVTKLQDCAMACFEAAGCRHLGRVDMILDENNDAYVLEINTLPGFTSHSLLPMAAMKAGMTQPQLCVRILKAAMKTFGIEK